MTPEEIRKIIDVVKKRQTEKSWTFKNGNDFWKHFYAQLFIILFSKLKKNEN